MAPVRSEGVSATQGKTMTDAAPIGEAMVTDQDQNMDLDVPGVPLRRRLRYQEFAAVYHDWWKGQVDELAVNPDELNRMLWRKRRNTPIPGKPDAPWEVQIWREGEADPDYIWSYLRYIPNKPARIPVMMNVNGDVFGQIDQKEQIYGLYQNAFKIGLLMIVDTGRYGTPRIMIELTFTLRDEFVTRSVYFENAKGIKQGPWKLQLRCEAGCRSRDGSQRGIQEETWTIKVIGTEFDHPPRILEAKARAREQCGRNEAFKRLLFQCEIKHLVGRDQMRDLEGLLRKFDPKFRLSSHAFVEGLEQAVKSRFPIVLYYCDCDEKSSGVAECLAHVKFAAKMNWEPGAVLHLPRHSSEAILQGSIRDAGEVV